MSLGTVHILHFWQNRVLLCVNTRNWWNLFEKSLHDQGLFSLVDMASGVVNKLRKCSLFFCFLFRKNNWQTADGYTNSSVWLCWHFCHTLDLQHCHTFKLVVKKKKKNGTIHTPHLVWQSRFCLLQCTAAYLKYSLSFLCSMVNTQQKPIKV